MFVAAIIKPMKTVAKQLVMALQPTQWDDVHKGYILTIDLLAY